MKTITTDPLAGNGHGATRVTLTLPAVDLPGNVLTPIILAAMERGAKTDNHPTERDLFIITFDDETDPAIEALEALLNPPSKKISRKD